MTKLSVLLAIALPFLYAASNGKARAQTFSGLPTTYVAKLAFASQASTTTDASLVAKGKTRYLDYKCDECHGANGEGGGDGPDLIGTHLNADEISKFLERPSPDAYMKGMPNIPTDSPDNQVLVAYVLSLKRPPEPPARPAQPPPSPREEPQKNDPPVSRKLSATEKAHILDGEFTIEKRVDRLPESLKSACSLLAKDHEFKIANPGGKFQLTDDVVVPWRRLIFAGISKGKYFIYYTKYLIHYEHGGIVHFDQIAVFDVSSAGKVTFHWGGTGGPAANDLAQLRTLISAGAFADDRAYVW